MEQFYSITDRGKIQLPTRHEIATLKSERNEDFLLVLDSSVCLDIINFVNNKKSARVDKQKILNLIEYTQKNSIQTTPLLALPELCYDHDSLHLNEDKLSDFKNKLDFAFGFPYKHLKRFEFDYDTNYFVFRRFELNKKSILPFIGELNIYYAALLKIRNISRSGLNAQLAEKNILKFLDWMKEDLEIILGPEFSLAIQIFGGNTRYRSMINSDASGEKARKALWGTAWDLFHARVSCNKSQFSQIVGRPVQSIFITKDGNLYNLLAPHVNVFIKHNSTKMIITDNNLYPPHYSNSFIQELNMIILGLTFERVDREVSHNHLKVQKIIGELEGI